MSKDNTYNIRIGKKLIPVNKELYLYYYRSRRRLKYYEHDIKIETAVYERDGVIIAYKPSKEDSLERLIDEGFDFASGENVEDIVVGGLMREKLRECLRMLDEDESYLILSIYGDAGKSERQVAQELGVSQPIINKRKNRILHKLKKLMQK